MAVNASDARAQAQRGAEIKEKALSQIIVMQAMQNTARLTMDVDHIMVERSSTIIYKEFTYEYLRKPGWSVQETKWRKLFFERRQLDTFSWFYAQIADPDDLIDLTINIWSRVMENKVGALGRLYDRLQLMGIVQPVAILEDGSWDESSGSSPTRKTEEYKKAMLYIDRMVWRGAGTADPSTYTNAFNIITTLVDLRHLYNLRDVHDIVTIAYNTHLVRDAKKNPKFRTDQVVNAISRQVFTNMGRQERFDYETFRFVEISVNVMPKGTEIDTWIGIPQDTAGDLKVPVRDLSANDIHYLPVVVPSTNTIASQNAGTGNSRTAGYSVDNETLMTSAVLNTVNTSGKLTSRKVFDKTAFEILTSSDTNTSTPRLVAKTVPASTFFDIKTKANFLAYSWIDRFLCFGRLAKLDIFKRGEIPQWFFAMSSMHRTHVGALLKDEDRAAVVVIKAKAA